MISNGIERGSAVRPLSQTFSGFEASGGYDEGERSNRQKLRSFELANARAIEFLRSIFPSAVIFGDAQCYDSDLADMLVKSLNPKFSGKDKLRIDIFRQTDDQKKQEHFLFKVVNTADHHMVMQLRIDIEHGMRLTTYDKKHKPHQATLKSQQRRKAMHALANLSAEMMVRQHKLDMSDVLNLIRSTFLKQTEQKPLNQDDIAARWIATWSNERVKTEIELLKNLQEQLDARNAANKALDPDLIKADKRFISWQMLVDRKIRKHVDETLSAIDLLDDICVGKVAVMNEERTKLLERKFGAATLEKLVDIYCLNAVNNIHEAIENICKPYIFAFTNLDRINLNIIRIESFITHVEAIFKKPIPNEVKQQFVSAVNPLVMRVAAEIQDSVSRDKNIESLNTVLISLKRLYNS